MSGTNRSGMALERPARPRSSSRFGDLGDRLARTFGGFDRPRPELPEWEEEPDFEFEPFDSGGVTQSMPSIAASRFPTARHGYDPDLVDEHIDSLETELTQLRAHRTDPVAGEIERIGEQTAAILRTAHRQAKEIVTDARAQADRCLQEAAANAVRITEQAQERLRSLDSETEAIWQERARLLDDARGVAGALVSLVDEANHRFPVEDDRPAPEAEQASAPSSHAPVAAAPVATPPGPDELDEEPVEPAAELDAEERSED